MGGIITESIGFQAFQCTRTKIYLGNGARVGFDAYSICAGEGCGKEALEEVLNGSSQFGWNFYGVVFVVVVVVDGCGCGRMNLSILTNRRRIIITIISKRTMTCDRHLIIQTPKPLPHNIITQLIRKRCPTYGSSRNQTRRYHLIYCLPMIRHPFFHISIGFNAPYESCAGWFDNVNECVELGTEFGYDTVGGYHGFAGGDIRLVLFECGDFLEFGLD